MPSGRRCAISTIESIYRWVYKPSQKRQKLYKLLTQHHAKRGRRKRAHRGTIKCRVGLVERPGHILKRSQAGPKVRNVEGRSHFLQTEHAAYAGPPRAQNTLYGPPETGKQNGRPYVPAAPGLYEATPQLSATHHDF